MTKGRTRGAEATGRSARAARKKELIALFRGLGAPDPDETAEAELDGEPQIARTALCASLWAEVPKDAPPPEMWKYLGVPRAAIEALCPDAPRERLLWALVRHVAVNTMLSVVTVLDEGRPLDPERAKLLPPGLSWGLVERADDVPVRGLEDLHESIYDYDPTGRCGEPSPDLELRATERLTAPGKLRDGATVNKVGKKAPTRNR